SVEVGHRVSILSSSGPALNILHSCALADRRAALCRKQPGLFEILPTAAVGLKPECGADLPRLNACG
ncbi:MAG: hypothetical protein ACRD10_10915, partial [Terriglobia bacterium]